MACFERQEAYTASSKSSVSSFYLHPSPREVIKSRALRKRLRYTIKKSLSVSESEDQRFIIHEYETQRHAIWKLRVPKSLNLLSIAGRENFYSANIEQDMEKRQKFHMLYKTDSMKRKHDRVIQFVAANCETIVHDIFPNTDTSKNPVVCMTEVDCGMYRSQIDTVILNGHILIFEIGNMASKNEQLLRQRRELAEVYSLPKYMVLPYIINYQTTDNTNYTLTLQEPVMNRI